MKWLAWHQITLDRLYILITTYHFQVCNVIYTLVETQGESNPEKDDSNRKQNILNHWDSDEVCLGLKSILLSQWTCWYSSKYSIFDLHWKGNFPQTPKTQFPGWFLFSSALLPIFYTLSLLPLVGVLNTNPQAVKFFSFVRLSSYSVQQRSGNWDGRGILGALSIIWEHCKELR